MSVYRDYSRDVWAVVREIVPTVEQTGIDEGYLDLGEVAADVRGCASSCGSGSGGCAFAHRALVLARGRRLEGGREDRVGPQEARRSDAGAARPRSGLSRALPDPAAARRRAARRGAPRRRRTSRRSATLAALDDDALRTVLHGKVGRELRDRARGHRPAPARAVGRANLDLERGDVRAGHRRSRAPPRRAPADGDRAGRPPGAARAGRRARSRPSFAIRTSRSGRGRRRCRSGRTTRTGSGRSRASCSIARCATGRARCASSASASPAWSSTCNFRCRPESELMRDRQILFICRAGLPITLEA